MHSKNIVCLVSVFFIAILFCIQGYYLYSCNINLPFFDDWRYLDFSGVHYMPDIFSLKWLFTPANDTIYASGKLFDFFILKITSGNYFLFSMIVYFIFFSSFLILFICLIYKTLSEESHILGLSIFLFVFSLSSNSYWGKQALAYHQILPLFFLSLIFILVFSAFKRKSLLIGLFSLLAGLSYISGAFLLLTVGLWFFIVCEFFNKKDLFDNTELKRISFLLIVLGVVSIAIQLFFVFQAREEFSLNTHLKIPVAVPWTTEFWVFVFSLYGKAFGFQDYKNWYYTWCFFVFMNLPFLLLLFISLKKKLEKREISFLLIFGSLTIGNLVYACLVSAGRAGIAGENNYELVSKVAVARFHYWWITVAIPFNFIAILKLVFNFVEEGKLRVSLVSVVFFLFLCPKSSYESYFNNWNYSKKYKLEYQKKKNGLDCLTKALSQGEIGAGAICRSISVRRIVPIINYNRKRNFDFIKELDNESLGSN